MNLADIKAILNYSAFRPEPDDPSAPWNRRFPNTRTVLVGLGKSMIAWAGVSKTGKILDTDTMRGDLKEILTAAAPSMKAASEAAWCAISLNTRYVISLETNLPRRPGSEEMMKTNPRSILGGRYERGKRYALTHNPETNSSVLLSIDEEQIRKVELMFKEVGLQIGRICCGSYVLLRHALSVTNTVKGSEKPTSNLYVICSQGAVCVLVQDADRWMELRSRTDVYEEDMQPVADLLAPFRERIHSEMGIVIACDQPTPMLRECIDKALPGHAVTDLTTPDFLWNLMNHS